MADTGARQEPLPPPRTVVEFVKRDPWSAVLFLCRVILLITSFLTIIPLLGSVMATQCYRWSMQVAATLYGIRLLQRKAEAEVPLLSFQFVSFFTSEDSGHYVWYSLLYSGAYPSALFLFPLILYTVFQVPQYAAKLTEFASPGVRNDEVLGWSSEHRVVSLNTWVQGKKTNILRFIATSEIFLMVVVVFNIFSGVGNLLAPVGHYYFLKWRYQSRRNPYTRIIFGELRVAAEVLTRYSWCPQFVKNMVNKVIAFLSSRAPPVQEPPPQ